jgi:hypothetical protein
MTLFAPWSQTICSTNRRSPPDAPPTNPHHPQVDHHRARPRLPLPPHSLQVELDRLHDPPLPRPRRRHRRRQRSHRHRSLAQECPRFRPGHPPRRPLALGLGRRPHRRPPRPLRLLHRQHPRPALLRRHNPPLPAPPLNNCRPPPLARRLQSPPPRTRRILRVPLLRLRPPRPHSRRQVPRMRKQHRASARCMTASASLPHALANLIGMSLSGLVGYAARSQILRSSIAAVVQSAAWPWASPILS